MHYRRIDITLPPDDDSDLVEWIGEDVELIDAVTTSALDNRRAVSLLLAGDSIELVLDKLKQRYGDNGKFRAVVLEATAIVPDPDTACADEVDEEGNEAQDEKVRAAGRIARDELLEDLKPGTQINQIYLLTVFLSAVIAAVGLIRDSPAVVIGAMVIAPLLLPNMSLALATTLGDLKLVWRSLWANGVGLSLALSFAIMVGLITDFDPEVREIAGRSVVGYSDVALALAAGVAGAIAVTSGVSANLIGVMVAVALLPPLVALGLLIGAGHFDLAAGAALLVGINIAAVNLAAVGTFWLRGIRPVGWSEAEKSRRATLIAVSMWGFVLAIALVLIWFANPEK